jgi:UDP-N-acetyl-D-mannosaminuronic acid transferase (WecB/TagA/CpsF family)
MVTLYLNPSSFLRVNKNNLDVPLHAAIYVDSILMCKVLKIFNIVISRRCFDLSHTIGDAEPMFKNCGDRSRLLFVGGSEREALLFNDIISTRFSLQGRIFTESGFSEDLELKIQSAIENYKPTHLILGLGAPLQERLALLFDRRYPDMDIRTCGGFITQTAISRGDFYPNWVQNLGVRWLYRFFVQPKVIYRIIFEYPIGVYSFLRSDLAKRYRIRAETSE